MKPVIRCLVVLITMSQHYWHLMDRRFSQQSTKIDDLGKIN